MLYSDLLLSKNWQNLRIDIINGHNSKCQICHNEKIINSYRKGVYEFTLPLTRGFIFLRDLNSGTQISLKISKEIQQTITISCFVVFTEKNDWINIVGYRKLNEQEIQYYFNSVKDQIAKFISGILSERMPKHISRNNSLKEAFKIIDNSQGIDHIIKQPVFELPVQLSECNWISFKGLHVHHKYYQKGKLPWEYPTTALTTLCWICHEELHSREKVPYLDENGERIGFLTPCLKCFGAGVFPEYNHIQSGICFRCNGAKYEEFI